MYAAHARVRVPQLRDSSNYTQTKIDWTCQQQIFEKVDVLGVVGPFSFPGRFSPLLLPGLAPAPKIAAKSFCHCFHGQFHVSISHRVPLFHIFTLNPVGIPAMCSVGIPAVLNFCFTLSPVGIPTVASAGIPAVSI